MENKYLEKIAAKKYGGKAKKYTDMLEVSEDGYVHNYRDAFDSRFKRAKNITPTNWKRVAKIGGAAVAVGATAYGAKKLYDRAMQKAAMNSETKKELANTATIGAAGAGTAALGTMIGKRMGVTHSTGKMALMGGALGLAGDYAAVKLNNHLNTKIDKI
jgi:hypothetical protein